MHRFLPMVWSVNWTLGLEVATVPEFRDLKILYLRRDSSVVLSLIASVGLVRLLWIFEECLFDFVDFLVDLVNFFADFFIIAFEGLRSSA